MKYTIIYEWELTPTTCGELMKRDTRLLLFIENEGDNPDYLSRDWIEFQKKNKKMYICELVSESLKIK